MHFRRLPSCCIGSLTPLLLQPRLGDDIAPAFYLFLDERVPSAFCSVIAPVPNFSKRLRTRSDVSAVWAAAVSRSTTGAGVRPAP
jgi:hypothetical protein